MTKTEDLKVCPFCGGDAEFDESNSKINDVPVWHVGCANEECVAYCLTDSWQTKAAAAKAWNTRPTVTPTDTAMEDAPTREDGEVIGALAETSSTTDGDAERALEWLELILDENDDERGESYKTIKNALQSTRKPERELDAPEKQVMHDALRSSVKVVSKPPVDTIAVPREVLQGVREALKYWIDGGVDYHVGEVALASLDAVFAEGE